jgi:hypothetical protein
VRVNETAQADAHTGRIAYYRKKSWCSPFSDRTFITRDVTTELGNP